jgi:hypothetical protein
MDEFKGGETHLLKQKGLDYKHKVFLERTWYDVEGHRDILGDTE